MNEDYTHLEERIKALEEKLTTRGVDNNLTEMIRDIVIYDVDNTTSPSQTATVSFGQVTIGAIPAKFGRVYFRGKAYNIALYTIA